MRNAKGQFMKGSKSMTSFKKGSVPWNKGKPGYSSTKKGKKASLETRKNMSIAMKIRFSDKTHHPRWKKDRTGVDLNKDRQKNPEIRVWRKAVFTRDNFRCRIGGEKCSYYIEAHHILSWREYPELRFDVNNGITLCKKHHPRKREDEVRLSPYFQDLLKK